MSTLKFLPLFLLLSFSAAGENVYIYSVNPGVQFYDPNIMSNKEEPDTCFPYCKSGMSEAIKNPDPAAREPQNLTACIYGADNILKYEREGKYCPYKFEDPNDARVERRRQEWLKNKGNLGR